MEIQGYKIQRKIGEGAMASVYLADQESLGRQVALKVLSPALAGQPGFTERFLKEGRIIAYLKHPQIVDIYDLGSHHQHYYLSMEYLSGGTLEQKIKRGLSMVQSVQMIKQISHALGFAHMNGVIHRDIKPQNIMFGEDNIPVLTDFGIARLMDSDPQLTIPGRTVGSPLYMSPEQISGHKIDARADLYSMGVLLYKMLTHQLPYRSKQFLTIALMHQTAPIPVLPQNQSLLQPVLNKLLAKEPEQRYSSAQKLIKALMRIQSNPPFIIDEPEGEHDGGQVLTQIKKTAGRKINTSDIGAGHLTAEPTRPVIGVGAQKIAFERDDSTPGADSQIQSGERKAVDRRTGALVQKAGLMLAVVFLVVVGGLYVLDMDHKDPISEPQHSTSGRVLQAKADRSSYPVEDPGSPTVSSIGHLDSNTGSDAQVAMQEKPKTTQAAAEKSIESLVARARGQMSKNHLTSPAGDNSYETYRRILSLDPAGQKAKSILMEIGNAYHQLALKSKANDSLDQALTYVAKGIELLPKNSPLLTLQDDLRARLAEKARIKQVQAEKAEKARIIQMQAVETKQLEDQRAMAEKVRKIEQELEASRIRKAELERLQSLAEQEKLEQQKAKIEIDRPVSTESESDSRKRLFGTF